MLPAAHRLRTSSDFRDTTRRGRKAGRGCVVVYLTVDDDPVPPLVGLVVSKQIGGSVQRHRAARRIRGAMAAHISRLPTGARIVVRALPGAESSRSLDDDLQRVLDQLLESTG